MKINKSYLFAAAAFLAIALWFWYNSAKADTTTAPTKPAAEQSTSIPTVVVESRNAEDHQNSFTLYGRSEANRDGVKQAQIELDNVNMRAPFSAIFDSQMAEVGDYLLPGQACGKLIEMNPLIVAVELTETQGRSHWRALCGL